MPNSSSSQTLPILLNLVAALLGALGQYLYKTGAARIGKESLLTNWRLFTGAALFTVVMVLFIAAFKLGGRLSVTYPAYATTFAWSGLIAVFLAGETWSTWQTAGTLAIMLGVGLIGYGATVGA